ncbi:hypothetical protein B0H17DRAFT_1206247 [Mycena rosella]|uniref:Glucose receptor Git3 N-terminal domain-containing protein n=1 Tax=Mycena rosella TaxID=1033263 RepID=A0AAD7D5F6_MYCRO|nr:hypothetical protein B0H17DRAFT_1206247 [Mycena rosella]
MSVRGISSWPACRSISRAGSQPLTPVYTSVQLASPSSTPSAASSQSRSPHKPSQAHPLLPIFKPMSRKPKHMLSSSLDIRSYLAFSLWFSCSFCYPVVDRYRPAVKGDLPPLRALSTLSLPATRPPSFIIYIVVRGHDLSALRQCAAEQAVDDMYFLAWTFDGLTTALFVPGDSVLPKATNIRHHLAPGGGTSLRWASVLVGIIWAFLILTVAISASVHNDPAFYAPTPYWCWKSSSCPNYRITLENFWLWIGFAVSVLYIPLLFCDTERIRPGEPEWWTFKLHTRSSGNSERRSQLAITCALAYCLPVLPTSLARWFLVVHGYGIFSLSGVCDVVAFKYARSGLLLFGSTAEEASAESEPVAAEGDDISLHSVNDSDKSSGLPKAANLGHRLGGPDTIPEYAKAVQTQRRFVNNSLTSAATTSRF